MQKAVFLDKDGTLVDNSQYPKIIPKDKLLGDILEGLKYIQNKRYKIFILSNQPWIAKGKMTKNEVEQVFRNITQKLKGKGITIDDYFYCPHQSSDNCKCKKPKNNLIKKAAKKHNINLKHSYIIGDMDQDILAGKKSQMKTILVLTGLGNMYKDTIKADYVINNLNDVKNIL